jgi:hypothetical protein
MDKINERREFDVNRQILNVRSIMNHHDLTFEQAAAVLQLSLLYELVQSVTPRST